MAAGSETKTRRGRNPAKRSPWRRRLLTLACLLIVLVWLAPTIIAKTPLLPWAVKQTSSDLNGSATVQSASLGWFSPIKVAGVEVRDRQGKPVASVASVEGDRSLLAILCNYTDLGTFHLRGVEADVVLRDDGSNVEDVLAKYLKSTKGKTEKAGAAPAAFTVGVEVADAKFSVADQATGRKWQSDKVSMSFRMVKGSAPMDAAFSLELPDDSPNGRRLAKLGATFKIAGGAGEASVSVTELPLALFRPLAARFWPGMNCLGWLSSEVRASWGGASGKNAVEADLRATSLAVASPDLNGDVPRIERFQAGCRATWQADRVAIEKCSVDCDLGSASLAGVIPLGQKDGITFASLLRQRQEFSGRLNLVRLAQLLPGTLRLRRNLQITSGEVAWAAASRPGPGDVRWHGQLDVAALGGAIDGRSIAWEKPLSATIDAHDAPAGPIVDALRCQSDFLQIQGAGTPDDLNATLAFNLQQLAARLGQFVDFGNFQFAGDGVGSLRWKRSPQQQFDAGLQCQVRGFQWSQPGQTPWHEDSVTIAASAQGQTDLSAAHTRLDAGSLAIRAGADQLDVRLAQPVASLGGVWPLGARMQGPLQSWPARLGAWWPKSAARVAGNYAVDAEATIGADAVQLRQGVVQVANLTIADASGQQVQEPSIRLTAKGNYDVKAKTLQLERCELVSSAVTAGAAGRIVPANGQNVAQFDAQFNYDLQRLSDLLRPCLGPNVRLSGRGSSQARYSGPMQWQNATASVGLRCDGANLYGFAIGPTDLKATMAGGVARLEPLNVAVGQGRLHLAPEVRLTSTPMELSLPKGPLVERVQLDPSMGASALKYAIPALSEATTVRGTFSVALDSCRIKIGDLAHSDLSGKLTIHTAEIGSGPMLHELSALLGRDAPAKLRQGSIVAFRMENGRVHHEGLELQFPELTIRTQGWVGLDQSLDILAEMPVPPKWLAGNATAAQAARGQSIRLPLKGTLKKPQLDRAEMERQSAQFLRKAAGNLLENGLNRFLGPKK